MSEATYYRWRNQYGGMTAEEAKRLKNLERENKRLKEIVAEKELDGHMLKKPSGHWLVKNSSRKRTAVVELQNSFDVSERRDCKVIGQPRSSQRYARKVREDEPKLVRRMLELARCFPRYGYRFIAAKLRQEGWQVNTKRIYRLWRREGLKVRQKKRKKRRLGSSVNSCHLRKAEHKDHVWCWDFVFDRTTSGSPLKWLSIVDEYTREP